MEMKDIWSPASPPWSSPPPRGKYKAKLIECLPTESFEQQKVEGLRLQTGSTIRPRWKGWESKLKSEQINPTFFKFVQCMLYSCFTVCQNPYGSSKWLQRWSPGLGLPSPGRCLSNFNCRRGPPRLVILDPPFGYDLAWYLGVTCWVGIFDFLQSVTSQLFEKGSRRNLKSDFGAFNMQWSFGSKLETSTKIFVKISFFNKIPWIFFGCHSRF